MTRKISEGVFYFAIGFLVVNGLIASFNDDLIAVFRSLLAGIFITLLAIFNRMPIPDDKR